jgi:cell fate (sporulation/competence/biofilm development) regulator YmcA (YheA/YmcA/DUF963 family)
MKLKKILSAFAIVLLISSCSEFFPPDIQSPEAIDKVVDELKEISKNYKIVEASIRESEKLSGHFGNLFLNLENAEGKPYTQLIFYNQSLPNDEPQEARTPSIKKKEKKAIDLSAIDKEKIAKYVEEAVAQIPEEYNFASVGSIDFSADDNGNLLHKIIINITEKNKSAKVQGRRIITEYYELYFDVDKDGNMVLRD